MCLIRNISPGGLSAVIYLDGGNLWPVNNHWPSLANTQNQTCAKWPKAWSHIGLLCICCVFRLFCGVYHLQDAIILEKSTHISFINKKNMSWLGFAPENILMGQYFNISENQSFEPVSEWRNKGLYSLSVYLFLPGLILHIATWPESLAIWYW